MGQPGTKPALRKPNLLLALGITALGWFVLIFFEVLGNKTYPGQMHLIKSIAVIGPVLFYLGFLMLSRHPLRFPRLILPRWLALACPVAFLIAASLSRRVIETPDPASLAKIVFACLCIGVCEEVFFRGTMFKAFQGLRGPWYLIASSALFAFTHISYTPAAMLNVLSIGLGYALARLASVPIWLLVVVHAAHNVAMFMPKSEFNGWQQPLFWGATVLSVGCAGVYLTTPASWYSVASVVEE